jgi:hypothetical protein
MFPRHVLVEFLHPLELIRALSLGARFVIVLAAFDGAQDAALSGARHLGRINGTSM